MTSMKLEQSALRTVMAGLALVPVIARAQFCKIICKPFEDLSVISPNAWKSNELDERCTYICMAWPAAFQSTAALEERLAGQLTAPFRERSRHGAGQRKAGEDQSLKEGEGLHRERE